MVTIVVELPDNRGHGAQLEGGVINVGSRSIDGFEELGHEMEAVSGGIQKLIILGNLVK